MHSALTYDVSDPPPLEPTFRVYLGPKQKAHQYVGFRTVVQCKIIKPQPNSDKVGIIPTRERCSTGSNYPVVSIGLSIGINSLKSVFNTLARHQRAILQNAGKNFPLELRLVYDNVLTDRASLSEVIREARDKCRKENVGPASGFMALSIGGVIGVGGVELPVDPHIWETHQVTTRALSWTSRESG